MKFMQRANKVLFFVGLSLPLIALVMMSWLVHRTSGNFRNRSTRWRTPTRS